MVLIQEILKFNHIYKLLGAVVYVGGRGSDGVAAAVVVATSTVSVALPIGISVSLMICILAGNKLESVVEVLLVVIEELEEVLVASFFLLDVSL